MFERPGDSEFLGQAITSLIQGVHGVTFPLPTEGEVADRVKTLHEILFPFVDQLFQLNEMPNEHFVHSIAILMLE